MSEEFEEEAVIHQAPEFPVGGYTTPAEGEKPNYKARDMALYHAWKGSGDKRALSTLMKQLNPLIYSEVRRISGTLPEAALSAEAKTWAFKALQTYDPTKGVALSTHVMNYLPKVRRLNYKYQNSARLPENLHLQYQPFHNAVSHLEEALNREPTDEEIAEELGWSKPQVIKFRGSLYQDLTESAAQRPQETSHFNSEAFLMDHILASLNEQETMLLFNKGEMSATELAAKLGVNVSRLNYLSAKLRDKIAKMKQEINMY